MPGDEIANIAVRAPFVIQPVSQIQNPPMLSLATAAMNVRLVAGILRDIWLIWLIYWIAFAFGNKKAKIKQSIASRLVFVVIFLYTYFAIVSHRGRLSVPLFRVNAETQTAGILLCVSGLIFAVWARNILGRNWSGFVTIKQDHELIQTGPYAIVRHPIYTGIIVGFIGTFIALFPTVEGCLLALLWIVAFFIKSQFEERILTKEFGDGYREYKKRVKYALFPFVF